VNAWIRTAGAFDGVIESTCSRETRRTRPSSPRVRQRGSPHPNDAGYKAMGDFIDLALLRERRMTRK